ncbi:MAG: hypothetical protein K8F30_00155 [Taibaiella sp.]|nr:hypothetical protein [Taibaiella sp.]
MSVKTLLLAVACTLAIGTATAQDKLYKKNGDMIEVNVTEVTTRTVSYKKADNAAGPTYTIAKGDVAKIVYENGSEDVFGVVEGQRTPSAAKNIKYGNNILSVMPMQITSNVGVGMAYERVLDQNAILSFYMPVTVAFNPQGVDPVTGASNSYNNNPEWYIMPGLKFYPTGSKGVVRYGIGPNLAYVTGKRWVNEFIYDNYGNITAVDTGWRTKSALGIMITNSLNINPTAHLHLGLELGMGFTYFNKIGNRNQNVDFLGQFGFKIGYRF